VTSSETRHGPADVVSSVQLYRDLHTDPATNLPAVSVLFDAASTWAARITSEAWLAKFGVVATGLSESDVTRLRPEAIPRVHSTLTAVLELYQQRLQFLNSNSYQQFGLIDAPRTIIAIDIGLARRTDLYLGLEMLLQEQLQHCKQFSLLTMNDDVISPPHTCLDVNDASLQQAYFWMQPLRAQIHAPIAMDQMSSGLPNALSNIGPDLLHVFDALL